MSNEEMVANRFGRWAKSRKLIKDIQDTLLAGGYVTITNYFGKGKQYDQRHIDMFKAAKNGAYVLARTQWHCIDFSNITLYRPVVKAVSDDYELMLSNRDF